ncbi:hypothetical protein ACTPEF_27285, partial [Clostridioides difficile]
NSNEDKKDDGKQEKTTKSSDSVELNISAAASLKEAMAKIEEEIRTKSFFTKSFIVSETNNFSSSKAFICF